MGSTPRQALETFVNEPSPRRSQPRAGTPSHYAGPVAGKAKPGATGRAATTPAARKGARAARHGAAADPNLHLVDNLVSEIQERIGNGDIPIGSWLRQEKLAQDLGVSRMPIREALRQLQAVGAVEIIPNRGARVPLPSTLDVIEVYTVRGILEGHAAAEAAKLITTEQLQRLEAATESFHQIIRDIEAKKRGAEARAPVAWRTANGRFHAAIIEACGNGTLAEVIDGLHVTIPPNLTWLGLGGDLRRLKRNATEHKQILAAISGGDAERARELVHTHADHASKLLVRALNDLDNA